MPPLILERFDAADLPWLVLRHQQGKFAYLIAGRSRDDDTASESLDEWQLAPDYAILKANPSDLERLGIEPDEVDSKDEIFAAIHELPKHYSVGERRFVRRTYGAETVFFRATHGVGFDFLAASGTLRREIFWQCRATAGGAHMVSCHRFPPAVNPLNGK